MTTSDVVTESMEDYLKTIFKVVTKQQVARPKDIAKILRVTPPSVTGALRSLAEKEFIHYSPYDLITLTKKGEKAAKDVVRRHEVLQNFFVKVLLVEEKEADEVACKMEHVVSPNILDKFISFIEFLEVCPRAGEKWIAGFGYYCDHDGKLDNCERCIELSLEKLRKKKLNKGDKTMTVKKLNDLKPGQKGRVVKVKVAGETGKRLVEMGVTSGTMMEVEKIAPLGDPIDVKVKGYHLSLRKEEASGITVEAV
jgi:DtxR family transcriptional regulator, Mn-dependent transcriptional regulator